ncbi:MAG: molybdopterin-dependent oxidoreductase [SAR324 cluster bacterium]|nr:molybdopterin-dependent oxidoreductase [SAR324 cluster bacterium]
MTFEDSDTTTTHQPTATSGQRSTAQEQAISLTLNGKSVAVAVSPIRRLTDVLREDLGLTGTKVGCDAGDCGACTVLIDGEQICACMVPVGQVQGRSVTTVEGLAQDGRLNALQQSFLNEGAAQCGICIPGMLMAASDLLDRVPSPSEAQVLDALGGVLCRCTGYRKIVQAVLKAAETTEALHSPAPGAAVGAPMIRVDGKKKVTGDERFGADEAPEGALWLRVLRSPHRRARFTLGDLTSCEERHPGLRKIFSAADIPGLNGFGVYPHIKDQPVLADGQVRYRGEAVVALVGDYETIERIELDDLGIAWTIEAPVSGWDGALSGECEPVQAEHPDNVLARGFINKGDVESGFRESDFVAEISCQTSAVEHCYIEPEAGHARRVGDRIELFVTTQTPFMDKTEVASVLGLDAEQIRVIPSAVGGGFGGKLDLSLQPLVALATWLLNVPVRCTFTRPESLASSTKRHPARIHAKAGCTKEGLLTALHFKGDFNTGAYASWGPTVADRVPIHCSGPYFLPSIRGETQALLTNEPPSGAFRGFGVPQASLACEGLMDQLAESIGMDALEFRHKNALRKGQRTASGQLLEHSAGQAECLEALRSRWTQWRKEAEEFNANPPAPKKRGVGVGTVWYGCGNTSMSNPSTMRVGVTRGGKLTLYNGAMDIGQGANTIMVQVCADALGVPAECFHFVMGDTDRTADAGKTSASRQAFISGKASQLAGEDLRRQLLEKLGAGPNAQLEFRPGVVFAHEASGSKDLDLTQRPKLENGDVFLGEGTFDPPTLKLDENGQGSPYATYGFGAQIAEVEVDIALGTVKVLRMAAAHDVGRVINPSQAEGQVHGGIAQGLGFALMEEYLQGVTENLHDYLIPTVGDMPTIETIFVEDPEPLGPYGAKGLGEHALIPTAPAILGGIYHATGARITRVPATPDRVREALLQQGRA